MNAVAWMNSLSTAGRTEDLPKHDTWPATIIAERWDGWQWVARKLVWNGKTYVEATA